MSSESTVNGLAICEKALDRLVGGNSIVPAHVSLDLSKLTASIVSLEAGFDRGYLKKSRKSHLPLLAKIEAIRASGVKGTTSRSKQLRQIEDQLKKLENELSVAQSNRDKALAQNIKLWERVRELELLLETSVSAKVEHFRRPR
ncbi:hypothetical protein [Pseudomonas sp. 65/3-MNA-CIBAN-0223]|uniref:hypothetical protein n=1 Tax=Pseudomonas sp. 65/3-MNA-CIBAN-0223 TaxID=3140476 RepID=UPI0033297584